MQNILLIWLTERRGVREEFGWRNASKKWKIYILYLAIGEMCRGSFEKNASYKWGEIGNQKAGQTDKALCWGFCFAPKKGNAARLYEKRITDINFSF